jgi:threonine synthase
MDVGNPSNFVRVLELLHSDLKERLCSVSINDEDTATTIRSVFEKYNYVLDPHGAVAYKALADYLTSNPTDRGIFLETAHPVKFDSVWKILGTEIPKPPAVAKLEEKTKTSIEIDADYDALKEILLSRI